jgi:acyl-CoA synthetase (AMP-forming)/AMP-acid ligase II
MNIDLILKDQAEKSGNLTAIDGGHGQRSLTFGELAREVEFVAQRLQSQGISKGTRVLVLVPMSPELYVIWLALLRLGSTMISFEFTRGIKHLEHCCSICRPDALIASPKNLLKSLLQRFLRGIQLRISTRRILYKRAMRLSQTPNFEKFSLHSPGADDIAVLSLTSGSSGDPKIVPRTYGFLANQIAAITQPFRLMRGQRDLVAFPLLGLVDLAVGVTVVIPNFKLSEPSKIDGAAVIRQLNSDKVTRMTASPRLLEQLVKAYREGSPPGVKLPDLEYICSGGAPVQPRLLRALEELAPDAKALTIYACTEAEPIATCPWREVSNEDLADIQSGRGLLVGKPVPTIELRILADRWGECRFEMDDQTFRAETIGVDQIGEIVVTGPHVIDRYLDGANFEETKFRAFGKVWHRTGDAGSLDGKGRLWLHGRCSAKIVDKGSCIYPFDVECIALAHDGVRHASLIKYDDQRVLLVEAEESEDLRRNLRLATASKQIDRIALVPALPVDRRHNSKIDYHALEQLIPRIMREAL